MTQFRISLVLASGLAFFSSLAHADTGFYVGGGFGYVNYETSPDLMLPTDNNRPFKMQNFPLDDNTIAGRVFGGWEFLPGFQVELGWDSTFSDATSESTSQLNYENTGPGGDPLPTGWDATISQAIEAQKFTLTGRYEWGFNDDFVSINFIGGYVYSDVDYENCNLQINNNNNPINPGLIPNSYVGCFGDSETDSGFMLGLGTTLNVHEDVFIRFEYDYYSVDTEGTTEDPVALWMDVGYNF